MTRMMMIRWIARFLGVCLCSLYVRCCATPQSWTHGGGLLCYHYAFFLTTFILAALVTVCKEVFLIGQH